MKASDENGARSKILFAGSRNGISLLLSQCTFVGVCLMVCCIMVC